MMLRKLIRAGLSGCLCFARLGQPASIKPEPVNKVAEPSRNVRLLVNLFTRTLLTACCYVGIVLR